MTEDDLLNALMAMRSVLREHCRRVATGEPVMWAGLGDLLGLCAEQCYDQELSKSAPVCR